MNSEDASMDELDVFGLLSGASAPRLYTFPQHVALITALATRLGLSPEAGAHLFNIDEQVVSGGSAGEEGDSLAEPAPEDAYLPSAAPSSAAGSPSSEVAGVLHTTVNPHLCVHLEREGAAAMLQSPQGIPTVLCRSPEEGAHSDTAFAVAAVTDPTDPSCHHGAPHVHCLRCFHDAVDMWGPRKATRSELMAVPPTVTERKHDWVAHHRRHRDRSAKLLGLLDGTRVAYVGDSDDEFDLDTEEGVAACEAQAAEEARHSCFLVSAGTAACPVLVAYCGECQQFAPLTRFVWNGPVADVLGLDTDAEEHENKPVVGQAAPGWDAWISREDGLTVVAKLLLASHLYVEGERQRAEVAWLTGSDNAGSLVAAAAGVGTATQADPWETRPPTASELSTSPRWVYLFKPSFFDLDREEALIDQFEDGVECTHGSAMLPAARVVGEAPDPKLLLLSEGRAYLGPLLRSAAMSPPYMYAEAVEGFLMDFQSPALALEKVNMVLRHDNHYHRCVRMVYVEDTQTWELAWILYHYKEEESTDADAAARAHPAHVMRTYDDPTDLTESIRMREGYTISVALPLELWRAYVEAARAAPDGAPRREVGPSLGEPTGAHGEVDEEAIDGLPFSLQSRTVGFFGGMASIALALMDVLARGEASRS